MDSGLLTKVFKVTARPFATTNPKGVEGKSALYRESDDLGTMSKKGRVFKGPDPKSLRGDACYFYRDIGAGSYGGDVNCLQQFLNRKGLLREEPTGYYGEKTETAVASWQVSKTTKLY